MLSLISSLSAPLHLAPHRMAQELVEHVHIAENHLYDYFHFFAQRINSVAKEVDTYGVMNWQWGSYTQARNWEDDESVIAEKTCLRVYNKRMRNVLKEAEKLNDEVTGVAELRSLLRERQEIAQALIALPVLKASCLRKTTPSTS